MTKIKSINIRGLRGVKENLPLELDGKSILIYGDSGSGKSSIADALEWFYYDRVEHLVSEEIGRGGIEAMRNILLDGSEVGSIKIQYTTKEFDSEKNIYLKKDSLSHDCSNESPEFSAFLGASANENLILRYRDLVPFIIATKKQKLDELSKVIGFGQVTGTRTILKTVVNDLKRELKIKDFDNQISNQQGHIIENFGHNIISDKQFVDTVNRLMEPLKPAKKITILGEIDGILKLIEQPPDSKIIELQVFYNKVSDLASNVPNRLEGIRESYNGYLKQFQDIASDIEKIKKLIMENLLTAGIKVLQSPAMVEDKCPLCLQPKNRSELLKELEIRIMELDKLRAETLRLSEAKESLQGEIDEPHQLTKALLLDEHFQSEDNKQLKVKAEQLKTHFENYLAELEIDVLEARKLKAPKELALDKTVLSGMADFCRQKGDELKTSKTDDLRFEVHSKIVLSKQAYSEIKKLEREKELLTRQHATLETVYSQFVKRQEGALKAFLTRFSTDINGLYQFMNPNENVKDIKLIPIEKDDELAGITIQFEFLKNEVAPPHKYLSESHLNCLGIAFFLTSVIAFNKENKFLVLDDVISSFDSMHRKRFADLLNEEFSDYQIILLTHEKNWFDYVANMVKGKDWKIAAVKWSEERGTYVDEPPETIKQRIETNIKASNVEGLGNNIRIYLERVLKEIAFNLKVKVDFLYNDTNEDRMSYELLSDLKSKINKHGTDELKKEPVIGRLLTSIFIGSKGSHDSSFDLKIGDLKAFWEDIKGLESLFYCDSASCKDKCVSLRHYDDIGKRIRCGCGNKAYDWKR